MDIFEIVLLSILGGFFVLFLGTIIVLGKIVHNKLFNYRYVADSYVKLYTNEEFNILKDAVEFKDKSVLLKGYLYHKEEYKKDKIIVYAHGMWSNHESYMQDICYLATKGYLVLGFDYQGVSISGGKSQKAFGNSIESLDYAIRYIKQNEELKNKDIYVVGHSWGAFAACNIVKFHSDIKGVCALAPFVSTYNVVKNMLPKNIKVLTPFIIMFDKISGGKYSKCNSVKSLNKYNGKVLIIHSNDDPVVKIKCGLNQIKEKTTNKNIKYLIVDGKKHQPHYSFEAIALMYKYMDEVRKYKGEELKKYKQKTDFHKMGELDPVIMDKIVDMIEE